MVLVDQLLKQAQELNNKELYSQVTYLLKDHILDGYQNADLYAEKAQAYYRLEKKIQSRKYAYKALTIDPSNAKANNYKGNLYSDQKKYDEAIECYKRALKTDPNFTLAINNLGNTYRQLNDNRNVIKHYLQVIKSFPDSKSYHNVLGTAYLNLKKHDKALKYFSLAMKIDLNYANAYYGIGSVYLLLNQYAESEKYFKKCLQIAKSEYPYKGLGDLYLELRLHNKAINCYNQAIKINSKFVHPYFGLGYAYDQLGKSDEAIKHYSDAIEVDTAFESAYFNRAVIYKNIRLYTLALDDYKEFIKLTKGRSSYLTLIAESACIELGKIINDNDYRVVYELIGDIKKLLLFKGEYITHYTSLSVTKALIIDSSLFRLSEGAFLNDTSEGRDLFDFLPSFSDKLIRVDTTEAKPFIPKPFIGSFVADSKHDDLTLWRMYGKENKDEARGCAITLERENLLESLRELVIPKNKVDSSGKIDEEFDFYRVAYRKNDKKSSFIIPGVSEKVEDDLNKLMSDLSAKILTFLSKQNSQTSFENMMELLQGIAYLFKSAEYQYEQELRLIVKGVGFDKKIYTDSFSARVYIDLIKINPLIQKITLGPKVEKAEEWASVFYYSLNKENLHPKILISHLPFK